MTAREKLAAAERATAVCGNAIASARGRILTACTAATNGYGIYAYPDDVNGQIAQTIQELEKARAAIKRGSVQWPTDADYDAAERESSEE
jgi:hypothetical protein